VAARLAERRANKFTMSTQTITIPATEWINIHRQVGFAIGALEAVHVQMDNDTLAGKIHGVISALETTEPLKGGDSTARADTAKHRPGIPDSPVIPSDPASQPAPAASPWVAWSEREPTEDDCTSTRLPHCVLGAIFDDEGTCTFCGTVHIQRMDEGYTHWMKLQTIPSKAPPQPEARQASQEELDSQLAERLALEAYPHGYPEAIHLRWPFAHGVRRALASERRYLGMPAEQFIGELHTVLNEWAEAETDNRADEFYNRIKTLLAKATTKP
jgi:hypothetical protein